MRITVRSGAHQFLLTVTLGAVLRLPRQFAHRFKQGLNVVGLRVAENALSIPILGRPTVSHHKNLVAYMTYNAEIM